MKSLACCTCLLFVLMSGLAAETILTRECDTVRLESPDLIKGRSFWELQICAGNWRKNRLVGGVFGVYAKSPSDSTWRRVVDCRRRGDTWWHDFEAAKEANAIFYPTLFYVLPQSDSLLLFDQWLMEFYKLRFDGDTAIVNLVKGYDEIIGKDFIRYFCPFRDKLVCGALTYEEPGVTISLFSFSPPEYKTIYRFPDALSQRLALVGIHGPTPHVATIPADSVVWVAFEGDRFVHVIGVDGAPVDSVDITAEDFKEPQPPLSRMKSKAVAEAWNAAFTPLETFTYASPDYVLLQYRTGWEKLAVDSLPLFSTVAWNTNRQPVEIPIGNRQQVAGCTEDGQVILAEYLVDEGNVTGIRLTFAVIVSDTEEMSQ